MPTHTSFLSTNATEIAINGMRCTKLLVPSIGSIIHVGSSVNASFDASDSSAMKLYIKIAIERLDHQIKHEKVLTDVSGTLL